MDGHAGYNLLKMRSYVDVDYVRFEPMSVHVKEPAGP